MKQESVIQRKIVGNKNYERTQMNLAEKDFKEAINYMFKDIKETMLKEVKETMLKEVQCLIKQRISIKRNKLQTNGNSEGEKYNN